MCMSASQCMQSYNLLLSLARFEKGDMSRLLETLQIPAAYTGYQGSVFTGTEGLMVMLRRLTYPNRWCDLVNIFGRSQAELSILFNMVNC